jgi:hypothetical protein
LTEDTHNDAPSEGARQRAIFVVGAGRSGTSAITRGVQVLGVDLGDRLKQATAKNPTGFFEDAELVALSKRVRGVLDVRPETVRLLADRDFADADLGPLRSEALSIIETRFAGSPVWGFKYSHTLRLLPFWEGVFEDAGFAPSFVVAARSPLSVARSRAKLDPVRGVQEKSDLEWLVAVVPYFRRMAVHPFVVVDYDLLMGDPKTQLERTARHLSLPLDDVAHAGIREFSEAFLSGDRRHTQFSPEDLYREERLNPLTRDAFLWLHRLATDEIAIDAPELWKDWSRIESALSDLGPVLRHIDHLEAQHRRSRWSPVAAVRAALVSAPRPTSK